MKKLNSICICSDNYPTKSDPTHSFVEQLCLSLSESGIKVSIIAPQSLSVFFSIDKHHPFFRRQFDSKGNSINIYQPLVPTFGTNFKMYNQYITKFVIFIFLNFIIKEIDAYYGHFWHNAYKLFPIAKKKSKPLYVATGESTIKFCLKTKVKDFDDFVKYVRGVICVSSKNKEESIRIGLTDGNNCQIIPNAINDKVFYLKNKFQLRKQYGYSNNDFIISFVGWWINRKGPQRVAEAVKMSGRDIKSFFIGGPNSYENIIPDCPGILFKGKLNHSKVSDFLNMSDVFVLPTLNEGCCNAVVEAMACGLPIISSDRSFNKDVLNDTNSILINPENVEEISIAIRTLFDDKELRSSLAAGALKSAKTLTLSERVKKIIHYISSTLNL